MSNQDKLPLVLPMRDVDRIVASLLYKCDQLTRHAGPQPAGLIRPLEQHRRLALMLLDRQIAATQQARLIGQKTAKHIEITPSKLEVAMIVRALREADGKGILVHTTRSVH